MLATIRHLKKISRFQDFKISRFRNRCGGGDVLLYGGGKSINQSLLKYCKYLKYLKYCGVDCYLFLMVM